MMNERNEKSLNMSISYSDLFIILLAQLVFELVLESIKKNLRFQVSPEEQ